jgi:hypothetical protein
MAIGFSASPPAKLLPLLKYRARDARFLCIDHTAPGIAARDVTENFAAVVDMERIEIGWMLFGRRTKPDLRLFPLGQPWPDAPSLAHKRGLRVIMQLSDAHGGDARELSSTSGLFLTAFDTLHDDYLAGRSDNLGKLPVVVLARAEPDRAPEFVIAGWVQRPETMQL